MMQLNKNYRVNKDPLNFVLEEKVKGDKKNTWKVIGYYGSMEHLKKAIVSRKIKDIIGDFNKLSEVYDELVEMIENKSN